MAARDSLSDARRCIGFGEFEDVCENEAGESPWSKLWCIRCYQPPIACATR